MNKYTLRVSESQLNVGWSAKVTAEFEPVAGCGEECFWVRVDSINEEGGSVKYVGRVEDYLTYTQSHGLTMGFTLEFGPEHVTETRTEGQRKQAN